MPWRSSLRPRDPLQSVRVPDAPAVAGRHGEVVVRGGTIRLDELGTVPEDRDTRNPGRCEHFVVAADALCQRRQSESVSDGARLDAFADKAADRGGALSHHHWRVVNDAFTRSMK